jgi:hypothetical protein
MASLKQQKAQLNGTISSQRAKDGKRMIAELVTHSFFMVARIQTGSLLTGAPCGWQTSTV